MSKVIGIGVSDELYKQYEKLSTSERKIVLELVRQTLQQLTENIKELLQQHSVNVNNTIIVVSSPVKTKLPPQQIIEELAKKDEKIRQLITQYVNKEIDAEEFIDNILYIYKNYLAEIGFLK